MKINSERDNPCSVAEGGRAPLPLLFFRYLGLRSPTPPMGGGVRRIGAAGVLYPVFGAARWGRFELYLIECLLSVIEENGA